MFGLLRLRRLRRRRRRSLSSSSSVGNLEKFIAAHATRIHAPNSLPPQFFCLPSFLIGRGRDKEGALFSFLPTFLN